MDGDIGEKLKNILADKDAMEKIASFASGLNKPSPDAAPGAAAAVTGPPASPYRDDRTAFIGSLRPLLREEKRKKLDTLQTALTLAELFGSYKKHRTE